MEQRKILEFKHNKKLLDNNVEDIIWRLEGPVGIMRLERKVLLINNFIESHVKLKRPEDKIRILELGSGVGSLTKSLICPRNSKITSLDIYDGFIRKAAKK